MEFRDPLRSSFIRLMIHGKIAKSGVKLLSIGQRFPDIPAVNRPVQHQHRHQHHHLHQHQHRLLLRLRPQQLLPFSFVEMENWMEMKIVIMETETAENHPVPLTVSGGMLPPNARKIKPLFQLTNRLILTD